MPLDLQPTPSQPSEQQFREVEAKINLTFPNDVKDFLRKFNGVRPEPNVFQSAGVDYEIRRFLMVDAIPDIKQPLDEFNPSTTIPIARDPSGNFFCVETSGPNKGKVFFLDHEIAGDDAFRPLTNSLEELLLKAQPYDLAQFQASLDPVGSGWIDAEFLKGVRSR